MVGRGANQKENKEKESTMSRTYEMPVGWSMMYLAERYADQYFRKRKDSPFSFEDAIGFYLLAERPTYAFDPELLPGLVAIDPNEIGWLAATLRDWKMLELKSDRGRARYVLASFLDEKLLKVEQSSKCDTSGYVCVKPLSDHYLTPLPFRANPGPGGSKQLFFQLGDYPKPQITWPTKAEFESLTTEEYMKKQMEAARARTKASQAYCKIERSIKKRLKELRVDHEDLQKIALIKSGWEEFNRPGWPMEIQRTADAQDLFEYSQRIGVGLFSNASINRALTELKEWTATQSFREEDLGAWKGVSRFPGGQTVVRITLEDIEDYCQKRAVKD